MYDPQVNDYVRWTTALGMVHEGWVYYKGKPDDNARRIKDKWVATSNYITIEIATKPRPQCDLSTFFHKRIHVCLCCYEDNWHELEFIRRRVSKQDDSDPDLISYGAYKSQQHRPLDVQVSKCENKLGLKCSYCVNPKEIMNSSEVLHEIRDLKDTWRKQNFVFSSTQQAKFDNLLEQRRDIVKSYYKNNLVYKVHSASK